MLYTYADLAERYLAMPVLRGLKTPSERFPGAVETMCIEAMMQDRKALQAGTSHFLGQNFARASGIQYQDANEQEQYAWTVSWGFSTRSIGGVIMTHGDDDGLILPPRVAPAHIVLMPIIRKDDDRQPVMEYTQRLARSLRDKAYHQRRIVVEIDDRDIGGARGWDWIKKGIPLRAEIGRRDMSEQSIFLGRRDRPHKDRVSMKTARLESDITALLDEIQQNLFDRALAYRREHTKTMEHPGEFEVFFTPKNTEQPEIHGGFAVAGWCGSATCEAAIKETLGVTIRCLPFAGQLEAAASNGRCVYCDKTASQEAVFAKAY